MTQTMRRTGVGAALGVLCLVSVPTSPAAAQPLPCDLFVDPDYLGPSDGSAARPWTQLRTASDWAPINAALPASDVRICFSAGEAGSEDDEVSVVPLNNLRTDAGLHWVTFDGQSVKNVNDAAPDWRLHSGTSRHRIRHNNPFSTQNHQAPYAARGNWILRGFKLEGTGNQALFFGHSVNAIIEENELWHTPAATSGPGLHMHDADSHYSANIIIRRNYVHDLFGEGIYINGPKEGCNQPGGCGSVVELAADGVQVLENIVQNAGRYGGEGDGIDIKDGLRNLVVRGNTVSQDTPGDGVDGIVTNSGGLFEGNFVFNTGSSGISLGIFYRLLPNRAGSIVRNNVVVNTGGNPSRGEDVGIRVRGAPDGDNYTNVALVNNTVVGVRDSGTNDGDGIVFSRHATGALHNNISFDHAGQGIDVEGGSPTQSHNLLTDAQLMETSPPYRADPNFRPRPGSPAIGAGVTLSGFAHDFAGATRTTPWDIGAFKFGGGQPLPPSFVEGTSIRATWTAVECANVCGQPVDESGFYVVVDGARRETLTPSGTTYTAEWVAVLGMTTVRLDAFNCATCLTGEQVARGGESLFTVTPAMPNPPAAPPAPTLTPAP